MRLRRIVTAVELLAVVLTLLFVVLLFVDETPGTEAANPPAEAPLAAEVDSGPNGAQVYAASCANCHGQEGRGGVSTAPRLAGVVTQKFRDERVQRLVIAKGSGSMPGFENRLSDDEIDAVVEYTRSLK